MGQRSVGRYEVLRAIGHGGMATVYLARQADLNREVALKELNVVEGADPRVARRFLREARLAGSLGHPNVVTVYDYFEFDGRPYIAMEYLPRGSLRDHVGRMSLPQIGGVLEGILAGLAHAERHDIVHRDLKPENVLVTDDGGVKIADFGIAKATSAVQDTTANITGTGQTLGTPNYIAPEQAMARELGPATDLYSLGVMAFEMFVGYVPFHDTQEPMAVALKHVNEPIPPVSSLIPDVDESISDWVGALLVKDPADRVHSAVRAREALEEILIDRLGPRWRRNAALPVRPGAAAAPLSTPPRNTAALPQLTMPPTTRRLAPEPTTRALPPETTPFWARRGRTVALAVLLLIGLVAFASGAVSGPGGKNQSGAGSGSTAPAQSSSTARDATPQPSPAQGSAPATAPATTAPAPAAPAPANGAPAAPAAPSAGSNASSGNDEQSDDPSDDAPDSGSP